MTQEVNFSVGYLPMPSLRQAEPVRLEQDEALIVAAGFEDRSLAFASFFDCSRANALFLRYVPDLENKIHQTAKALENCGLKTGDINEIEFSRFEPGGFCEQLTKWLVERKIEKAKIDISAMSKLAICLILDVCNSLDVDLTIFYAEAASYGPTKAEYDSAKKNDKIFQPSIRMFTGLEDVVVTRRLSSTAMQGQPIALITFMSFNEKFTQALLNRINPRRLFLINGRPPELSWREEATAWIHETLRSEWNDDNPIHEATKLPVRSTCTRDYQASVYQLLSLYWELSVEHKVLIAPTGSKMQALASYIVKAMHKDIHMEYPTPKGYLRDYSSGIGSCWMVSFGKFNHALEGWKKMDLRHNLLNRID